MFEGRGRRARETGAEGTRSRLEASGGARRNGGRIGREKRVALGLGAPVGLGDGPEPVG